MPCARAITINIQNSNSTEGNLTVTAFHSPERACCRLVWPYWLEVYKHW